jgi:3-hydroxyacyl-[acyl-carrier-protein] dehydratase
MHYDLVDAVIEREPGRIVTVKAVSQAEEYLQDHFPTFPVLPGVLMLEACVQACRRLLQTADADELGAPLAGPASRYVLGAVKALKYGTFVPPGNVLRIDATLTSINDDGEATFKVAGVTAPAASPADDADATPSPPAPAVSGRLVLRPMRPA